MIVFLNGEFLPAEQAHVSVLDRGFIFGDGIYEVIPAYNGKLLRLEQHLTRLKNNLDAIRLTDAVSDMQWEPVLKELLSRNGPGNMGVYLQVTRGVAPRDHTLPDGVSATIFAMCNPIAPPAPDLKNKGVAAITLEDSRWKNCHIKAISLLPNILLRQQAVDAGAVEAILIRDDEATEGAASNVFIVKDKVLITPPKGPFLLPGITRDLVLELAAKNNVLNEERAIKASELHNADEIWLTSSTREILPVTQLDGKPVGDGKPGLQWLKMFALFQDYKSKI